MGIGEYKATVVYIIFFWQENQKLTMFDID